ncbi:MAG: HAMP domain-containing protein [Armatimonadetes bacterium]|nr:HAMP domain-containing protein [Armatimonadota bacterium]
MIGYDRLPIRRKLALVLVCLVAVAIIMVGGLGYVGARSTIVQSVSDKLTSLREARASHVQAYLRQIHDHAHFLADDPTVRSALASLTKEYAAISAAKIAPARLGAVKKALGEEYRIKYGSVARQMFGASATPESLAPDEQAAVMLQSHFMARTPTPETRSYAQLVQDYDPFFRRILRDFGYTDILIVDAKGQVVYSTSRDAEFGRDLIFDQAHHDNLTDAFRAVSDISASQAVQFADFARYLPSGGEPAFFAAARIVKGNKMVGALIFHLSIREVDRVMTGGQNWDREGLGQTGETYLVGPDRTLRSSARGWLEDRAHYLDQLRQRGGETSVSDMLAGNTSALFQYVSMEAASNALKGQSGVSTERDTFDRPVLVSYGPFEGFGLHWAILSQQSLAEAFAPLRILQLEFLITTAILVLITFRVARQVAGRLVLPLEEVSSVAHRFGLGETGVRVKVHTEDEVGELGHTLNGMMESLEKIEETAHSIRRNIVHDLKTPVTVIKGVGETLLEPGVGDDPQLRNELLAGLVEESDRLLEDLKDILEPIDFTWKPHMERFDLAALIQKVATAEKHTSRAENHEIIIEGADEPCWITADVRKVRRVIENFLSNAVKYSPGAGKHVWLRLQCGETEVAVEIQDEGLGMSQEEVDKVMSHGGRVVESDLGIEGSGIGLQSCIRVVEAHGGRLDIKSERGKGTTVRVLLPVSSEPC